jgi:hypothetical protein
MTPRGDPLPDDGALGLEGSIISPDPTKAFRNCLDKTVRGEGNIVSLEEADDRGVTRTRPRSVLKVDCDGWPCLEEGERLVNGGSDLPDEVEDRGNWAAGGESLGRMGCKEPLGVGALDDPDGGVAEVDGPGVEPAEGDGGS